MKYVLDVHQPARPRRRSARRAAGRGLPGHLRLVREAWPCLVADSGAELQGPETAMTVKKRAEWWRTRGGGRPVF